MPIADGHYVLRGGEGPRYAYHYVPDGGRADRYIEPAIPTVIAVHAHRAAAGTFVLDAIPFPEPFPELDAHGRVVFAIEPIDDGSHVVYGIEPETGAVVGTGRRVPPPGVPPLTNGIDRQLVDRDGRLYYRDGDYVNAEPIHRAGMDGTTDELVLDWGDEGSCLLTRIVAVGPEGHVLSRQRPDPGWRTAPDGVVCLFGPDGALVLRLPEDPDRVWVGFSDPIHWL